MKCVPSENGSSEADLNEKQPSLDTQDESTPARSKWGSQAEFLLSSMGYAIGLANLWRFPYLCMRNGGGAFLIPYMVFMVICGMPMFFLELIIGQFSGEGALTVWKLCPLFSGIGWSMLIATGIFLVTYNLLFAWALYYLGMSLRSQVPWRSCGNPWNTPICQSALDQYSNISSAVNTTLGHNKHGPGLNETLFDAKASNRSAAEEFYLFNVLNISTGLHDIGDLQWHLVLALLGAVVLTFLCMCKGIKSSGKVVYVTVTLPYILLTILLIRGVTLPGSLQGIKYYIIPKWEKLLEFKVWTEACLQVFYTLGPAWGGLIALASYNKFHNNCVRDSIVVCASCTATSFYGGFIIFSIIGYMAHEVGQPIDKVIAQGPGLAFVAYPEAISHMPLSPFWAVCFFCVLISLGIDGQFANIELMITSVCALYPPARRHKTKFVAAMSSVIFLLCLPLTTRGGVYLFQFIDWYAGQFSAVTIALCELVVVSYFYGIGRFYNDMTLIQKKRPSLIWAVLWCGVTPCLLVMMLTVSAISLAPPRYGEYLFPEWSQKLGWFVTFLPIIPMPLVALINVARAKGNLKERLQYLITPPSDWLPTEEKYHSKYVQANSGATWRQRFSLRKSLQVSEDLMNMEEKLALNA